MVDVPFAVSDCTKRQGYGLTRGTLIGVQYRYGSFSSFRDSRSCFAHGSSGSSPGLSPPSFSISLLEPPPTHGPERSGWPSGNRGTGPLAIAGGASGVNSPDRRAGRRSCSEGAVGA